LQIGTVLDVGTHEQTMELRLTFPELKHVLFEPASEFHSKIAEHYSGMDFELVPLAVSNVDGTGHLKKYSIEGGGVTHSGLVDPNVSSGSMEISTTRLDTFLKDKNFAKPYLLEVDIDGYEIPALEGASGIFDDVACVIVEATRETFAERLAFLATREFELFDIVDTCYYYGIFSQADLVFINNSVAKGEAFRPWQTREFDRDKWIQVASFEPYVTAAISDASTA
jgi:FkbM family methyltransferase